MKRVRVIPTLLLDGECLIKTKNFKNPIYIGDPINAVKIFNDKEVDELVILDIYATSKNKFPNFNLIKEMASEAFMPLAYGGGIKSLEDAEKIFSCGIEKIILNYTAHTNPNLIREITSRYGNQAVIISVDIKKSILGNYNIYLLNGKQKLDSPLIDHLFKLESLGIGELLVNSIDCDGTMLGYDIGIFKKISNCLKIPVIALGGAGNLSHLVELVKSSEVSAVAAGSIFIYHGKLNGILINYPSQDVLFDLFCKSEYK